LIGVGHREESLIDAGHESVSVLHFTVINSVPKGSLCSGSRSAEKRTPLLTEIYAACNVALKSKTSAPGRPGEVCLDF
jgi:hypothetical protein